MKINFHHGNSFVSKVIRFVTGDYYNHVSVEINNVVYESHMKVGVIATPIDKWDSSCVIETIELHPTEKNLAKTELWARKQLGKGYDYRGILSFIWIFCKQSMGRFFCSELAFILIMKAYFIDSDSYSTHKKPEDVYEFLTILNEINNV